MRGVVALLLVLSAGAGQQPARPGRVVVLPTVVRDSMSAIWARYNLQWIPLARLDPHLQEMVADKPPKRYLGCLTGEVAGDTVWVRQFVPATGLKQGPFVVTGDCSAVAGLLGTWHTHPYRIGYNGHPVKERGLSGPDFRLFADSRDLVTIVLWDRDSLDGAARGPQGQVRHPVTCIVR